MNTDKNCQRILINLFIQPMTHFIQNVKSKTNNLLSLRFQKQFGWPPRRKSGIESVFIRVYPWLKLSDTSFEAHAQQLLRFHREFHRQFLEDFLAETVDDHVHGVLRRDAALVAVENLVLANLRRGRLVLDARGPVLHFDVRERVRAALVADEQRVTL